jgi:peptidoglycan-associated lipoprotein
MPVLALITLHFKVYFYDCSTLLVRLVWKMGERMKAKKWIHLMFVACGVMTLAACSAKHTQDQAAINDANAAYNQSAESSGLGDESSFGDDANGGSQRGFAKRTYYFDYDQNIVHSSDKPAIAANAAYLVAHPSVSVTVEGHTDPRGSREYNIGLGERRARAVADLLKARGVNPSHIHIVSYGAEKLAVPGRTESDYQQDRRVVLIYFKR